jgi:hypothetical protein
MKTSGTLDSQNSFPDSWSPNLASLSLLTGTLGPGSQHPGIFSFWAFSIALTLFLELSSVFCLEFSSFLSVLLEFKNNVGWQSG